ncbi:MAG: chromosomal replication initiator protein DnaA [Ignavibacteriaceae bacterium]|jgi:chromosomal replication initiator protein|nr:chromosomal replication initiator protein DnaA [Ignavibacteriaceae bacterium]
MEIQTFWNNCLIEISSLIPADSYKTWIEPLRLKSIVNNEITLLTSKGEIHSQFLEDKFKPIIQETTKRLTGTDYTINFESDAYPQEINKSKVVNSSLNKDFCFDNYIVGKNNEFAHSAAFAVAGTPGSTKFNPLFIYGRSGLGKTHLLQAIGNHIINNNPDAKVVYTSSVQFVDDYIKYIELKKTDEFSLTYKNCDILLMDDIQFLSGKQGTQEVFFHIFNDLFLSKKQIVITSDKVPKDLDGLEDRLVSRFQSGLTVDIQPPNFETKVAILHKKATKNQLNIPEDVIEYIARNSSSNVREMEGYLIKILAYSSMYNVDIDYTKAIEILNFKNDSGMKKIYVEEVIDKVASYYKTTKEKIIRGNREKENVIARQMAMYLSKKMTNSTLKSIGKIFMKDHSTVIHGCQNIEKLIEVDQSISNDVFNITKSIID